MTRKQGNIKEAAGFAAGGGSLGAVVSACIGNMGLVGAFGGVAIGSTPVVGAGVVLGMAVYGIKKVFEQGKKS